MPASRPRQEKLPDWLRWSAILWLLIWFPAYWHTWGAENFLHLCDLAVILTCIGFWADSALLAFEPSDFLSGDRLHVDTRRRLEISSRASFDRRDGIPIRRAVPTLGPPSLALSCGDADRASVGAPPHRLRPEGTRAAISDRIFRCRGVAPCRPGRKHQFCLSPTHSSIARGVPLRFISRLPTLFSWHASTYPLILCSENFSLPPGGL